MVANVLIRYLLLAKEKNAALENVSHICAPALPMSDGLLHPLQAKNALHDSRRVVIECI